MIHILTAPATTEQLQEMGQQYADLIKVVVDVRRGHLAGGSEMHYECEEALLDNGSALDDLWGANWFPANQRVEFESLINIRPRPGNRSMIIQSEEIRNQVETIVRRILGDISP